jgi:hypothetical protein
VAFELVRVNRAAVGLQSPSFKMGLTRLRRLSSMRQGARRDWVIGLADTDRRWSLANEIASL